MANKSVFASAKKGKTPPPTNTTNSAGGVAYRMEPKAALAQYAATGTFNDGFYTSGKDLLTEVLALAGKLDVEFLAKMAIYSRDQGRMKDMPALLAAHLANRGPEGLAVLKQIFLSVVDNGKMLRNFIQIIRSGQTGRKSLGTAPKKLVQSWFDSKTPEAIFRMSIGNDPSMADVIKLAHPIVKDDARRALYGYLIDAEPGTIRTVTRTRRNWGKKSHVESPLVGYDPSFLPELVKEYELLKKRQNDGQKGRTDLASLPKLPFEMLTGLPLGEHEWKLLALQATWTQLRMNLNTFARHGVFKDKHVVKEIALRLKDKELIEKAKPFPYQIFAAYLNTSTSGDEAIPQEIHSSLHAAMEIATTLVPAYEGDTFIALDTSGSMSSAPITGTREGATTKMWCIDVAALIACTFLRKNPNTKLFPFDVKLHAVHNLDPNDTILTNAKKLRSYGGGGTDCGLVLTHLNKVKAKGDLVIYVSDNESWFDGGRIRQSSATSMANEWAAYKVRNPKAKLVCIDLIASSTVQVTNDPSVLNIGGFSDSIWEVIKSFVEGTPSADHWVRVIEAIQLPTKA